MERLLAEFELLKPTRVHFDLTRVAKIRLFGEGRLLGLLARTRELPAHVQVSLNLTKDELIASRAGKYADFLRRSAAGYALTEMADSILDSRGEEIHDTVLQLQHDSLAEGRGIIGLGNLRAAPRADRLGRPPASPQVWNSDIEDFRPALADELKSLLGQLRLPRRLLDPLAAFVWEAISNTEDHATRDVHGNPMPGFRFLTLRRLNLREEPVSKLTGGLDLVLDAYLNSLAPSWGGVPQLLLEVTVADSGIGIPATMASTKDIYSQGFADEFALLLRAMEEGATSRPLAGAGQGLFNMLEAVYIVRGMLVVRTGRCHAYRHFLSGSPVWPNTELHSVSQDPASLIGGTAISLLLPLGLGRDQEQALRAPEQYDLSIVR